MLHDDITDLERSVKDGWLDILPDDARNIRNLGMRLGCVLEGTQDGMFTPEFLSTAVQTDCQTEEDKKKRKKATTSGDPAPKKKKTCK